MTPEIWGAVAAFLLAIAAVAGGMALFKTRGRWVAVAVGARAAGTASVAVALGLAVVVQGEWWPFETRQVVLGLVLAMLSIQMVLSWRLRIGSGGPVADVVAVALILVGTFLFRRDVPPLTCAQRAAAFWTQWILLLLGGGGVLVAGSAGLMLALRKGLAGRGRGPRRPKRGELYNLLTQAIFLALVALGGGLTVSVWWAWQTGGTLTGGDPREVWMAITWLAAAMSQLAWQLEGHRGRWAAGLALVAASSVVFGLVLLTQLQSLLGI
jgi:ABC-type transport system involved in cytochrome c biogenesis permease subunit